MLVFKNILQMKKQKSVACICTPANYCEKLVKGYPQHLTHLIH